MKFDITKITKNKKMLIIIGVVLAIIIALLVYLLVGYLNKDKYKDKYKEVEKNIVENIKYLKAQQAIEYGGENLIFNEKDFKTEKMSDYEVLAFITKYLMENQISEEIDEKLLTKLEDKAGTNPIFTGKTYRDYAKKLLNIDLKCKSVKGENNQIFNFEYVSDEDAYIITPTEKYDLYEELYYGEKEIVVEAISSRSTSKTIETTIVVGYVKYETKEVNGETSLYKQYYKDKDFKNLVFEINTSDIFIPGENDELVENPDVDKMKNHEKDFAKYVVTSTKTGNNFAITRIKRK